ncbi:hypothetical protein [Limnohabitans sp. Rim28]|uniref:hypothetical protein n=1 Tax=Limnohabitans sp. Rim28 TaxID=1100720 RepID=UPI0010572104|nr:hypothetical protein [Limnohabitans sp. Rim28]
MSNDHQKTTINLDGGIHLTALHAGSGFDQGLVESHLNTPKQTGQWFVNDAIAAISALIKLIMMMSLLDIEKPHPLVRDGVSRFSIQALTLRFELVSVEEDYSNVITPAFRDKSATS